MDNSDNIELIIHNFRQSLHLRVKSWAGQILADSRAAWASLMSLLHVTLPDSKVILVLVIIVSTCCQECQALVVGKPLYL